MAGAVRFDFQGYYMMAAMHAGICLLLGVLVWLFFKGTKKLGKDPQSGEFADFFVTFFSFCERGLNKARKRNDHEAGM